MAATYKFDSTSAVVLLTDMTHLQEGVSARAVAVFIVVAETAPTPQVRVEKRLGISQSSLSRAVKTLGTRKGGMGLIEAEKNEENFRENILTLTDEGRELAKKVGLLKS